MIFWFFGFPGIGKDFCARLFAKKNKLIYFNGDTLLTDNEKYLLKNKLFTKDDRHKKLQRIGDFLEQSLEKNSDIVITDSIPDKNSRQYLFKRFKEAIVFIQVVASKQVHQKRIENRKSHFFTADLLKDWIDRNWDEPDDVPHFVLENNSINRRKLLQQLDIIQKRFLK